MVNGTLVGKLMETAKPEAWSLFRGYEEVKEHLDSSIEAMLKENKNKDVALTGLQREINRMLAK